MSEAQVAAQRAKVASAAMAKASTELKNKALFAMAAASVKKQRLSAQKTRSIVLRPEKQERKTYAEVERLFLDEACI